MHQLTRLELCIRQQAEREKAAAFCDALSNAPAVRSLRLVHASGDSGGLCGSLSCLSALTHSSGTAHGQMS